MSNVTKYMTTIFFILLFLIGITSSVYQLKNYNLLYNKQKESMLADTLFQAPYKVEQDIISSSELIASLFYELEYDIQVNDILISKLENGDDYVAIFSSKKVRYERTYVYDASGNIVRIVYNEISIT